MRLSELNQNQGVPSYEVIASTASITKPVESIEYNQETLQQMTSFVYLKLSQIQYDMMSFGLPKKDIKQLINKYLKQSKIIQKSLAQEIMLKLQLAEKRQT